jgi:hypothetical protein
MLRNIYQKPIIKFSIFSKCIILGIFWFFIKISYDKINSLWPAFNPLLNNRVSYIILLFISFRRKMYIKCFKFQSFIYFDIAKGYKLVLNIVLLVLLNLDIFNFIFFPCNCKIFKVFRNIIRISFIINIIFLFIIRSFDF